MERKLKEAKENNFQVIIIGHIAPLERDGYIYKPRCYVAFLELLGSFLLLPPPSRGSSLIDRFRSLGKYHERIISAHFGHTNEGWYPPSSPSTSSPFVR
jgi:hypothetical protein